MNHDHRVVNFGSGPACLPLEVLEQIQGEFLNFDKTGVSIIELGHRTKEFTSIVEETIELFHEVGNIPENYEILFVHGGARLQFSAIPMNLFNETRGKSAWYVNTGTWSHQAIEEAKKFGDVKTIASSENDRFKFIPKFNFPDTTEDISYFYLTSNNTIYGTQWHEYPKHESIPLVIDVTSDILSKRIDTSGIGILFAGAQKNLGPAGVAVVIIRKDLLKDCPENVPDLMKYKSYSDHNSLKNTPNTFAIYCINLMLKWMKKNGGLENIEESNNRKSAALYDFIDQSSFYFNDIEKNSRSKMNVIIGIKDEKLNDSFVKEALENDLYALKGHRSVGGLRASIYNSMKESDVERLIDFMKEFERKV